jgi:hypothetical protein
VANTVFVAISKGMILTPECGSGVPIPFLLRENRAVRHGRMVGGCLDAWRGTNVVNRVV